MEDGLNMVYFIDMLEDSMADALKVIEGTPYVDHTSYTGGYDTGYLDGLRHAKALYEIHDNYGGLSSGQS